MLLEKVPSCLRARVSFRRELGSLLDHDISLAVVDAIARGVTFCDADAFLELEYVFLCLSSCVIDRINIQGNTSQIWIL